MGNFYSGPYPRHDRRRLPVPPVDTPGLTPRERDTVAVAATLLDHDTAKALGVSLKTARIHLMNARKKFCRSLS